MAVLDKKIFGRCLNFKEDTILCEGLGVYIIDDEVIEKSDIEIIDCLTNDTEKQTYTPSLPKFKRIIKSRDVVILTAYNKRGFWYKIEKDKWDDSMSLKDYVKELRSEYIEKYPTQNSEEYMKNALSPRLSEENLNKYNKNNPPRKTKKVSYNDSIHSSSNNDSEIVEEEEVELTHKIKIKPTKQPSIASSNGEEEEDITEIDCFKDGFVIDLNKTEEEDNWISSTLTDYIRIGEMESRVKKYQANIKKIKKRQIGLGISYKVITKLQENHPHITRDGQKTIMAVLYPEFDEKYKTKITLDMEIKDFIDKVIDKDIEKRVKQLAEVMYPKTN